MFSYIFREKIMYKNIEIFLTFFGLTMFRIAEKIMI